MSQKRMKVEQIIRTFLITLAIFMGVAFALPVPSMAQTLNNVIQDALDENCKDLGGPSPVGGSDPFEENLQEICRFPGMSDAQSRSFGSVSAGATLGSPATKRQFEERLVIDRLSLFTSGEYEKFKKNATTFEGAYKSDSGRLTLGADYLFSNQFVAGLAFTYSMANGDFNGGGGFDVDSYGPAVYANMVPAPNFFIEAVAGYTHKDHAFDRAFSFSFDRVGASRRSLSGVASGRTDGNEFKSGVSVGYDATRENLTIGPRLGVIYKRTKIDGFSEQGNTGLELVYDGQNETSLMNVAGVFASKAISTGFGVLTPQIMAEWIHEFEDNQRAIQFRFAEDKGRTALQFQNDPPDRNYFNVNLGVAAVLAHGLFPFFNYQTLLGYEDQSSHTVTAGLRVEF